MNRNPAATLASIARLMPALIALSQSSAPASAINSLFAVTIDLRYFDGGLN